MISVEPCASAKLCVELRDTYPSNLDVPRRMTRPVRRGVQCMGGSQEGEHTSSRISIRFSTSVRLIPSGDCSTRNVIATTKGICCASTPSSARSSGAMGRDSGESLLVSGPYRDDGDWSSLRGAWILADMQIFEPVRGYGGGRQSAPHLRLPQRCLLDHALDMSQGRGIRPGSGF